MQYGAGADFMNADREKRREEPEYIGYGRFREGKGNAPWKWGAVASKSVMRA